MKSRAAVAFSAGMPLEVVEVDLEGPREGEVMVEIKATGICHTDEFTRSGADPEGLFPAILGHEGAGVVVDVGPGVKSVKEGDHVIPLYTPECRECPSCLSRKTNLCTAIRSTQGQGLMPDGTSRFSLDGKPIHHYMWVARLSRTSPSCPRSPSPRCARTHRSTSLLHRLRGHHRRWRCNQYRQSGGGREGGGVRTWRYRAERNPRTEARRRRYDHRRRPELRTGGVGKQFGMTTSSTPRRSATRSCRTS